jgi:hypothetical protein
VDYVKCFLNLSGAYKSFKNIAYENLSIIKEREKKNILIRLVSKHPFDTMKNFSVEIAGGYLKSTDNGKMISFIFGEFDEKMSFYPTITEKILNVHGLANLINRALKTRMPFLERKIVIPLQDVLLDFFFLEKTFLYFSKKANLINGKIENIIKDQKPREELLESYHKTFKAELIKVVQACIDIDHLNSRIKQFVFKDYAWLTYEVGNDGKVVNEYFLPKKYWEPFLKRMAAQQAEAMVQTKK